MARSRRAPRTPPTIAVTFTFDVAVPVAAGDAELVDDAEEFWDPEGW